MEEIEKNTANSAKSTGTVVKASTGLVLKPEEDPSTLARQREADMDAIQVFCATNTLLSNEAPLIAALRRKVHKAEADAQRLKEGTDQAQLRILVEDEQKRASERQAALQRVVEARKLIAIEQQISFEEQETNGKSSLTITTTAKKALEELKEVTIATLLRASIGGGLKKREEKAARKEMELEVMGWQEHIKTLDIAIIKIRVAATKLGGNAGENKFAGNF